MLWQKEVSCILCYARNRISVFVVGMVSRYQSEQVLRRLTSRYAFTLGGGADSWRSVKQKSEVDSTT